MLGTPLGRILLDRPVWTYLLGPFFKASTPDQSAPLSATYREAGAVGALTIVDTTNKASVAGGALVWATANAAGDPGLVSVASFARVGGRAILASIKSATAGGRTRLGLSTTAALLVDTYYFEITADANNYVGDSGGNVTGAYGTTLTTVVYDVAIVLRPAGMYVFARVAGSGPYTLVRVGRVSVVSGPYYVTLSAINTTANAAFRSVRTVDLGGAFASTYGLATDRKATSAATDTITHTANGLIEHTITAATGVTQELWVRRTDASNGWIVRMSQAGSTIKLIEIVAGVETERASTAQTWTNATQYRVVVICDGTTIALFVDNVTKNGYASASTNQTATTAYVSDAGTDLVAWPRTVALPNGV